MPLVHLQQARNDRENLTRMRVKAGLTPVRERMLHVLLEHSTGSFFHFGALSVDLGREWDNRLRRRRLNLPHPRDILLYVFFYIFPLLPLFKFQSVESLFPFLSVALVPLYLLSIAVILLRSLDTFSP
jgi:hypothetical protein